MKEDSQTQDEPEVLLIGQQGSPRTPVKALLARHVRTAFHQLGAIHIARKATQRNFRILMYHNFSPDTAELKLHCEHLRRYYTPVSMSQIADSLITGHGLPSNAVAITVDDGYRDFLLYAHPRFQEYGIPSTVFLTSQFLDGDFWFWWNRIEYAIGHSQKTQISLRLSDSEHRFQLRTSGEKLRAIEYLTETLKSLPDIELRSIVEQIVDACAVSMPSELPEKWKPMRWKEVQDLSRQNVEFGGHTRTHPILSKVSSLSALQDEIEGCKKQIEERLGLPVHHFCYPNGRFQDIGEDTLRITKESGYRTGVTAEWGMNRLGSVDAFSLRRLPVTDEVPLNKFAELLAGSPFAVIRNALGIQKSP